jgi:hypothetical protein
MQPLRLAIFAGVFGVALSGLFSLLENLSEPELLRSKKAVLVKGCAPIESEDAARLCPQLFCQKFLLDARAVELRSLFEVTVDQRSGGEHLIGGVARPFPAAQKKGPEQSFACLIENEKVVAGRVLEAMELEELSAQTESWRSLAGNRPSP